MFTLFGVIGLIRLIFQQPVDSDISRFIAIL